MEMTLQDVSTSRDEAVNAHNEAQSKVVSLLSQVRNLRTEVEDVTAERDMLLKEKKMLEARLTEAGERLEDLAKGESPAMRNAAGMDREILELKSKLAQQEDVSAAAVGKMRRAEALAAEMQKELTAERESNAQLFKEKAALEKQLKEVQLKCVDLETKGYSSASQDIKFLHKRVKEVSTVCICAIDVLHANPDRLDSSKRSWKSRKTNAMRSSALFGTSIALSRIFSRRSNAGTRSMPSSTMTLTRPATRSNGSSRRLTSSRPVTHKTSSRPDERNGSCGRNARSVFDWRENWRVGKPSASRGGLWEDGQGSAMSEAAGGAVFLLDRMPTVGLRCLRGRPATRKDSCE